MMKRTLLLALRYLKYRLSTGDAHSIHSPFVFDLHTKVICAKTDVDADRILSELRNKLLSDHRILNVIDYGTAEGQSINRKLSINYIASNYASGIIKAGLLYRLSKYFSPQTILEFGTSLGVGTTALALGSPNAKIVSLEGSSEVSETAKENLHLSGIKNVEVITGEFSNALPLLPENFSSLDLVYLDGNHRSAPTLSYFEQCLSKANENSLFIFDDIHWSADMESAWKQIQNHPRVSVTIDLFHVGLVFFRKGIAKQNFILKF
jgi:predicted O-methyltransferase YrrM